MKKTKTNAANVAYEVTVAYKPTGTAMPDACITSSDALAQIFASIWEQDAAIRERFYAIYLNRVNKVIGWLPVSAGGISGTVADPTLMVQPILAEGVLKGCKGICIAHNHPSGNNNPSTADIQITRKIYEGCKLFDITLLDHIILIPADNLQGVNPAGYFSFADNGTMRHF